MALDSNLESLFEKLKVEDPILPPSTWESIPSQNDAVWFSLHSSRKTSTPPDSLCDTFSVSEASLVRLALNALQGLESAIVSIEKLSAAFCSDPSDRTSHRIPSLWTRLSSTHALGNILRSIGCVGTLVFLLREFVEKYAYPNSDAYLTRSGLANGEGVISQSEHGIQKEEQPPYSLVNQAFAVAVRKVLEGYICALDTLYASVSLRRSSQHAYVPLHEARDKSCIRSVVNSEVTLLEVYLHSEELRTKIEALGNICNLYDIAFCFSRVSFEELKAKANLEVLRFYRGGNLLTYLYTQLKVSDPAQRPLLKFLFLRSCECYCGFIRSWILNAEVNDPYQEFILDIVEDLPHDHHFKVSALMQLPLARIRDGVAVPCFLKDILVPIIRSGQQLQVLKKLFELCKVGSGNHAYEGLLPGWSGGLSERLFNAFTMTFSKGSLEGMVTARNDYYKNMEQKLNDVLSKLEFSQHQRFGNGEANIYDDQRESLGTEVPFIVDDLFNTPPASDQQDSNVDLDNMISGSSSTTDESNLLDSAASDSDYSSLSYSEEQNESEQFEANNLIEQEGRYLSSLRFSCGNSICNLSQKFTKRTSKNIADNSGKKSEEPNLLSQIMPLGQGESNRLCTSDTQRKENVPSKSEMTSAINVFLEEPIGEELKNCTYVSNFLGLQPYSADFRLNFLSANPMFRISALLNQASNNGERCGKISQKSLPCFDFSTVEDPFKVSKEKSTASCLKTYVAGITDSIPIDKIHDKDKQSYDGGDMLACKTTGSSMYLPINTKQHGRDPVVSTKASGGSSWESLLDSNTNLNHNRCAIDHKQHLESMFEIPLDIVIDKCLVQEVLLQYKYVSKLAIKLLEEGFDLQEHLLALRRYFFMEVADWADLFIMSIWHHKWSVADADQRASEIQRFLKSSIQKSSCEQDFYKDQLFVYMKADDIIPLSPSAIGVRSFDFFGLGYRVNWPISIVVTPASLRIYAEIFSFLIQVKLAVFSLTDVWNSLKDLMQDIYQNQTKHKQVVGHCDMLVKLRHQVNHFVTTLQDYVLSQLAQVSWCRFIDSLKHKAKDMMDLESVHMEYLTDSLHICFLSNETRHIASIIEGMLQCALDFRSCLNGSSIGVGIHQGDSEKLSRINIAQVHKIKQMFHKNLIDLHLCYLKSPKHGEFGLSRFWGYLNYNEYYSDISDNIYTFRI